MPKQRDGMSQRIVGCMSVGIDMPLSAIYVSLGIAGDSKSELEARKTLARLTKAGFVCRTSRGIYRLVAALSDETGLQYVETAIRDFLSSNRGAAKTRDIHYAVWNWSGSRERTTEYYQVHRALRESPLFENAGHGIWRLVERPPEPLRNVISKGTFSFTSQCTYKNNISHS